MTKAQGDIDERIRAGNVGRLNPDVLDRLEQCMQRDCEASTLTSQGLAMLEMRLPGGSTYIRLRVWHSNERAPNGIGAFLADCTLSFIVWVIGRVVPGIVPFLDAYEMTAMRGEEGTVPLAMVKSGGQIVPFEQYGVARVVVNVIAMWMQLEPGLPAIPAIQA